MDVNISTDPSFDTAIEVSDFMLEETRVALMDRDFDAFAMRCHFPQAMGTFQGVNMINSVEDFRPVFQAMCIHFDTTGVIDLRRKTLEANFVAPDIVEATFESRHLMAGFRLSDEIFAKGTLQLMDGRWLMTGCHYATKITGVSRALSCGGRMVHASG